MPTPLTALSNVNKVYFKALERAGADTVEKLRAMTMHEVGKIKGLGTVGQIELKRALMEMGLTFRGEG